MRKNVEQPTIKSGGLSGSDDSISSHPAYGQITAVRRQGGGMALYGSDFVHSHTIAISISASELHRGLSRDWYMPKKELIEVVLSEAQWATFVSSLNQGSGPCCTIQHVLGEQKPYLPDPEDRTKQFSNEMSETLQDALNHIAKAQKTLEESGLPKKKIDSVMSDLRMAKQEINSNMKFVAKQFEEAMETTVETAKAEIHGYMNSTLTRAGLDASQAKIFSITQEKEDDT